MVGVNLVLIAGFDLLDLVRFWVVYAFGQFGLVIYLVVLVVDCVVAYCCVGLIGGFRFTWLWVGLLFGLGFVVYVVMWVCVCLF